MPDRIPCAIPFCRRTMPFRPQTLGWICGNHWRLTSRAWRKRFFLFKRRQRFDLAHRMWIRLKDQAIERSAGIAA